jgi:hypothetical protein
LAEPLYPLHARYFAAGDSLRSYTPNKDLGVYNMPVNSFKWKHFAGEIILQTIRWYLKYSLSYRNLEEMMAERGVEVDHTTIMRWVHQYSP